MPKKNKNGKYTYKGKEYTHYRNKANEDECFYNGLGMSPRPTSEHQRLVFLITSNVLFILSDKKMETYPEVEMGETNSISADVTTFDKKQNPVFALEIETTKGIKGTVKKAVEKAFPNFPTLKEIILYDYQKKIFYRVYKNGAYKVAKKSAFLGVSLETLVKESLKDKALSDRDKEISRLKTLLNKKK